MMDKNILNFMYGYLINKMEVVLIREEKDYNYREYIDYLKLLASDDKIRLSYIVKGDMILREMIKNKHIGLYEASLIKDVIVYYRTKYRVIEGLRDEVACLKTGGYEPQKGKAAQK